MIKNIKDIPKRPPIGPNCKCLNCCCYYRQNYEKHTCSNFKNGIPEEILSGEKQHDKPLGIEDNYSKLSQSAREIFCRFEESKIKY